MCPWEFFRSYRYTLLLVVPSWNDSVSDTLRDPAGFASSRLRFHSNMGPGTSLKKFEMEWNNR